MWNVKWSRYRSGLAQRVGICIALLFHDRSTRRGWVVSCTTWPHFTPGKDPVPILQEAGWAPGPVWKGGKSRPHRDSIPDRPARSQSLYWLSYPAQLYCRYFAYFQANSLDMNLMYKVGVRAGCKKQKLMRPDTYSVDTPTITFFTYIMEVLSEVKHTVGQVLNLYCEFILWNFCKEFIKCSYSYRSSLFSFSNPVLFLILNTVCHWWFANDSTSGLYESIGKLWTLHAGDGRVRLP